MRISFLIALASTATILAAPTPTSNITWIDCKNAIPPEAEGIDVSNLPIPSTLKCGTIPVPLNHSQPISQTNSIVLHFSLFEPASATRLVNFNPGGPGLPSIPFVWLVAANATPWFTGLAADAAFLGIDTRGIGASSPLECNNAADPKLTVNYFPRNEEEYNALQQSLRYFIATCPPNLVSSMTSRDTARDWDIVRQALRYDKMSLLSISYGTRYAEEYVRLFPQHVENVVLDAVIPPSLDARVSVLPQFAAQTRLLERADAFCMVDPDCALHDQGKGAIIKAFNESLAKADRRELGEVTADDIRTAFLYTFLSTAPDFPALNQNLSELVSKGADSNFQSTAGNPAKLKLSSAANAGRLATVCGDLQFDSNYSEYASIMNGIPELDPYNVQISETMSVLAACSGWPFRRTVDKTAFKPTVPVLMITSDFDWNTPVEWTIKAFAEAENNVTLMVRHGDLHGSFWLPGPVHDVEFAYLNNGASPPPTDSAFMTIYAPGSDGTNIKPRDPYATILGQAAGDVSKIQTIEWTAENSTSDAVYPDNSEKSGGASIGRSGLLAAIMLGFQIGTLLL